MTNETYIIIILFIWALSMNIICVYLSFKNRVKKFYIQTLEQNILKKEKI